MPPPAERSARPAQEGRTVHTQLSPEELELVQAYRRLVARETVPGYGALHEIRVWWNGSKVQTTMELRK